MRSKIKTLVSITIVIILTILFHYFGWLRPIENFFRAIVRPGSQTLYTLSVKINGNEENFSSVEELQSEYVKIKGVLSSCQADIADYKIIQQENSELREQLGFIKRTAYTTVGAEVIGKNIDPLGNTIILNRGNSDGVATNAPVVAGDGVLIGKVLRVEESTSIVRLINDNQSRVAVTVVNNDHSIGLVEGGYGLSLRMNYIPQNETINVGEIVITSGLEKGIPKGLLVGKIEAVEKEAYQPFQRAVLTPFLNLDKLSLVSVISL